MAVSPANLVSASGSFCDLPPLAFALPASGLGPCVHLGQSCWGRGPSGQPWLLGYV